MDETYLRGLEDAKALLDEGIFTQEEFENEKQMLLVQQNEHRKLLNNFKGRKKNFGIVTIHEKIQ